MGQRGDPCIDDPPVQTQPSDCISGNENNIILPEVLLKEPCKLSKTMCQPQGATRCSICD